MIMKKYLLSLLAVAAVVGCTTFEDEQSDAVVTPTVPSITVSEVGDTEFSATIAAQSGTGFYSYAILPGAPQELNATTLFKVGYKNALAAGTVDYAKEQFKTIPMKELDRNAVYTVYAVAASEQGTVGEVVSQKVTTSDAEIPTPKSISFEDNVLTLTLSEAVSYTGKKAIAKYYAANTPSGATYNILENKEYGTFPVTVEANGNTATFTFGEDLPNGAYFSISYPAGTFEDAVGNPVNALESGFGADKDGKLTQRGITGRVDNENFDLTLYSADEEEAVIESVSDLMAPIWISVPEDYIHFKATVPATTKGIEGYSIVYEGEGESHTYTTPGPYDYGWNGTYNCALAYPNALSGRPDPAPGQNITITIPEGFLTDIWGNVSNEFVIGPFLYSFGYEMEDIYGTYTLTVDSQYAGEFTNEGIIIAPAPEDDEDYEGMDVIIHHLFTGTICCDDLDTFTNFDTSFGATFNPDSGVLQFGWYDAIGTGSIAEYDWDDYVLALSLDTDDNTFSFQMPEKGKLTLQETLAIYCNGLGTWDRYRPGTTVLTKVSDEYKVPARMARMPRTGEKVNIQNKIAR